MHGEANPGMGGGNQAIRVAREIGLDARVRDGAAGREQGVGGAGEKNGLAPHQRLIALDGPRIAPGETVHRVHDSSDHDRPAPHGQQHTR